MSQSDHNPARKAVALQYENGNPAPVIVASGMGYMAEKIVEVAAENGVPVRLVYAFPGDEAPAPPAGLEDCVWFGGARGWWLRFEPA